MSKKVAVISTSLRKGSFSEQLAHSFAEGAEDAGNEVSFITLKDKTIGFCTGCNACQKKGRCVIKDDAPAIVETIRTSDVVVWATPIYYYSCSGQMKTLIDRANSIYASEFSIKDVYLIVTCADENEEAIEGTLKVVQGWVDCLEGTRIAGTMTAGGLPITESLEGKGYAEKAYDMGRKV
jgi:multimeric flavodoxin WrbA